MKIYYSSGFRMMIIIMNLDLISQIMYQKNTIEIVWILKDPLIFLRNSMEIVLMFSKYPQINNTLNIYISLKCNSRINLITIWLKQIYWNNNYCNKILWWWGFSINFRLNINNRFKKFSKGRVKELSKNSDEGCRKNRSNKNYSRFRLCLKNNSTNRRKK
jgi:hypothetical protein